jgi:hypothetical protein
MTKIKMNADKAHLRRVKVEYLILYSENFSLKKKSERSDMFTWKSFIIHDFF